MINIKHSIIGIAMASALSITSAITGTSQAAPLPNGSKLTITQGVGSGGGVRCQTGSCFGWELTPGVIAWADIGPGTDGGIVIGKNQASGGQELAPSGGNSTSGEMTSAFIWLGQFGTFATVPLSGFNPNASTDASINLFDDTSCSGAGCIGVTELGTLHWAWNGSVVPFGSDGGCLGLDCTADQLNGIFVSNWTVNPDQTYSMDYSQAAPDQDPSGFGNVHLYLHLEGAIVAPVSVNAPEVSGIWNGANPQFLFIFGKNFLAPLQVEVNGVTVLTTGDPTLIIALLPSEVTPPFTVKVTTPDGMDSFPKACPAI